MILLGLAMTFKDFLHIQNYFTEDEKTRSVHDGDPCAGYILVRSLPSYDIFYRVKGRQHLTTGDYKSTDRGHL